MRKALRLVCAAAASGAVAGAVASALPLLTEPHFSLSALSFLVILSALSGMLLGGPWLLLLFGGFRQVLRRRPHVSVTFAYVAGGSLIAATVQAVVDVMDGARIGSFLLSELPIWDVAAVLLAGASAGLTYRIIMPPLNLQDPQEP